MNTREKEIMYYLISKLLDLGFSINIAKDERPRARLTSKRIIITIQSDVFTSGRLKQLIEIFEKSKAHDYSFCNGVFQIVINKVTKN